MEEELDFSLSQNKAQNRPYPRFITYQIMQIDNSKKFRCGKCMKLFEDFFYLKRHYLQVELKIKEKCLYCGQFYPRIKEHYPHCSKFYRNHLYLLFGNEKKLNYKKKHKNINSFCLNHITEKCVIELSNSETNHIIDNSFKYFPGFLIGKGSYGGVVFGIELKTNTPVAVKVQKNNDKKDYLESEYIILSSLPPNSPLPKVFYHETNDEGNLLIESLIGPDLDKLFKFCSFNLDLKTICNIGYDILVCLEELHNNSFVHLDIKLDNIGFKIQNIEEKKNEISCVLLDFGKSLNYLNNKKTKNFRNKNYYGGNIQFSSINVLNGGNPNPKDDLENLIYVLVFLYKGSLPWSFFDSTNKKLYIENVLKEKNKFNILNYCGKDFIEISYIYEEIKKLKAGEKPNYSFYRNVLNNILKKFGIFDKNNYRFKWQYQFNKIMTDFFSDHNINNLNDVIYELFEGFPSQIVYSYISQYYN